MARTNRGEGTVAAGPGSVTAGDAEALLRRLAAGHVARREASGQWRLAGHPVAADLLARLVRDELVAVRDGEARATELGVARVERLREPDRPNRWLERAGRAGRAPLLRDRLESPLAWLARRRMISATQLAAGERLRADWQLAHAHPSVTMRWEPVPRPRGAAGPADPGEPGLVMLDARRRVEAALAAAGPGLAAVLERVVCAGEGLAVAERSMGWPARAGKVVLGLALDRLAQHYGLAGSEACCDGRRTRRTLGAG